VLVVGQHRGDQATGQVGAVAELQRQRLGDVAVREAGEQQVGHHGLEPAEHPQGQVLPAQLQVAGGAEDLRGEHVVAAVPARVGRRVGRRAVLELHGDQRDVGGAPADVDDQDVLRPGRLAQALVAGLDRLHADLVLPAEVAHQEEHHRGDGLVVGRVHLGPARSAELLEQQRAQLLADGGRGHRRVGDHRVVDPAAGQRRVAGDEVVRAVDEVAQAGPDQVVGAHRGAGRAVLDQPVLGLAQVLLEADVRAAAVGRGAVVGGHPHPQRRRRLHHDPAGQLVAAADRVQLDREQLQAVEPGHGERGLVDAVQPVGQPAAQRLRAGDQLAFQTQQHVVEDGGFLALGVHRGRAQRLDDHFARVARPARRHGAGDPADQLGEVLPGSAVG
jgi:hypothetical protein